MARHRDKPPRSRPQFAAPVSAPAAPRAGAASLTSAALAIAVIVTLARAMMNEVVRDPAVVVPGAPESPAPAAAGTGLLLDLLAMLCPLLVLARRWRDPSFVLRLPASPLLLVALAATAVVSTAWASDKYAALVSSLHLLAAAGVVWAVAECVRRWRDVWTIAAVCAGLLGVLLAHGAWHHFVERQDLIDRWYQERVEILRIMNIEPGSFAAIQLENGILHGELRGFSNSANTYAAQLVLLGLVTLGAGIACVWQKRRGGAVACGLLVAGTLAILPLTESRAAYLTGSAGFALLVGMVVLSARPTDWDVLRRRSTLLFMTGVILAAGVAAFIVGFGVSNGGLDRLHPSLGFRWRYWLGSAELVRSNPLLGVGWDNFGLHYLGVRIPEATEEVKDPHNYLVRFAAELGLVGLLLAVAWTVRAFREMTRITPALPESPASTSPVAKATLVSLALPIVAAVLVNFFAAVDLVGSGSAFAQLEFFRRVVYGVVLLGFGSAILFRLVPAGPDGQLTLSREQVEEPWLRRSMVVALAVFLAHNLLDFAMFEPAAMFLMALVLGTAAGASLATPAEIADPAVSRRRRKIARTIVAAGGATWVLTLVVLALPIAASGGAAVAADQDLRADRPEAAARGYEAAFANSRPRNAGHADRAGRAWLRAGQPARAAVMFDASIEANPMDPANWATRAELRQSLAPPDAAGAVADFREAVRLDPMNRQMRLRFAVALERIGANAEAFGQYLTAIELNERLTREEKKRFSGAQLIEAMNGAARNGVRAVVKQRRAEGGRD